MVSTAGHEEAVAQLAHPNRMKEQLQAGDVVSAMSIRYSRGIEIVGYAKAAGMDGVLIDLEHRYGCYIIHVL
jgi:transposase